MQLRNQLDTLIFSYKNTHYHKLLCEMEMVPFHIWSIDQYHVSYNVILLNHQLNYSKGSDLLLVQYNSKSERKQKINTHEQYNYDYKLHSLLYSYIHMQGSSGYCTVASLINKLKFVSYQRITFSSMGKLNSMRYFMAKTILCHRSSILLEHMHN